MRYTVLISVLIGSCIAIRVDPRSATLVTRDTGYLDFNPPVVPAFAPKRLQDDLAGYDTNAKRFAAGLPPKAPRRRWTPTREARHTSVEFLQALTLDWTHSLRPPCCPSDWHPLHDGGGPSFGQWYGSRLCLVCVNIASCLKQTANNSTSEESHQRIWGIGHGSPRQK